MTEVPELRTERLLMRGWRFEDYEPLAEILADPAVGAGVGKPAGFTPHEAWLDLSVLTAHWALRGFGHWALEDLESGDLIGRAGLYYPPDWPAMEVGWTVGRKHWGKGYAPEAARAACAWAHDELGQPTSSVSSTRRTRSPSASPKSWARRSRASTAPADSTSSCTARICP